MATMDDEYKSSLRQVIRHIMIHLEDAGRVAYYEDLLSSAMPSVAQEIGVLKMRDQDFNFLIFMKNYPLVFQSVQTENNTVISLTRHYFGFCTRLAMGLESVDDESRMKYISIPRLEREENYYALAREHHEYEYCKGAIAVLEVLNQFKLGETELSIDDITDRFLKISYLAMSALRYCADSDEKPAFVIGFLSKFPSVFKIKPESVSIDQELLSPLKEAFQLDLQWSIVGHLVTNNHCIITDICNKVPNFMKQLSEVIPLGRIEDTKKILESRKDICLLPQNGMAYFLNPCVFAEKKRMDDIVRFFQFYLNCEGDDDDGPKKASIEDLIKVLEEKSRYMWQFEDKITSLTLAAFFQELTEDFEFKHGSLTAITEDIENVSSLWSYAPIEISRVETIKMSNLPEPMPKAAYAVGEILYPSCRSAIYAITKFVDGDNIEAESVFTPTEKIFAFCHVKITTVNGEPIQDFFNFSKGHAVGRFTFQTVDVPKYDTPCHLMVLNFLEGRESAVPQLDPFVEDFAGEDYVIYSESATRPIKKGRDTSEPRQNRKIPIHSRTYATILRSNEVLGEKFVPHRPVFLE